MSTNKNSAKEKVNWEAIEALESIANQCIYKGKEVAQARSILKNLYSINPEYNDEESCSRDDLDDNSGKHPIGQ